MQSETLTHLKETIVLLDNESKQELADFLAGEIERPPPSGILPITDEIRSEQLEWLKKNRENYSGKYVALSGGLLVGEGNSLGEAREVAEVSGFRDIFVTFVYSEKDEPFGGW